MLEHFLQHLPAYLASAVGLILAELLRRAIRKFDHASESLVKGNLAFREVVERKPEYMDLFQAWKRGGDIAPRSAKTAGK